MRRKRLSDAMAIVAALAIGWLAWSGHVLLLPLSTIFPLLWSKTAYRSSAGIVSASYFLAASRGLPQGVASYYETDLWPGMLLWLVASSAFVTVHSILWTRRSGWHRAGCYLIACGLMAVPPFGILGWAHPATSAGVLFPDWGWLGLAATVAGLAIMTTGRWPAATIAFAGLWLWSAATWGAVTAPAPWRGADFSLGASLGRSADLAYHRALAAAARQSAGNMSTVIVLPEGSLGLWTPTVERLWRRELFGDHLVILAGATVVNGEGYDNVLVSISADASKVIYRQRMPVPGSMWQPWRRWFGASDGARAHFLDDPVATVANLTIAPLICYEQLLVWPILQAVLHDPDIIVGIGNGWWTVGTSVVPIQRASMQAWARLFGLPLVSSFNM